MAAPSNPSILLSFLFISQLSTHSAKEVPHAQPTCQAFGCNRTDKSRFPISNFTCPEWGLHSINCDEAIAKIQFEEHGRWYVVKSISYQNKTLVIQDSELNDHLHDDICNSLDDFMLPSSHSKYFKVVSPNSTFLKCKHGYHCLPQEHPKELLNYTRCKAYDLYYSPRNVPLPTSQHDCSVIKFPMMVFPPPFDPHRSDDNLSSLLDCGFALQWSPHVDCFSACLRNKSTTSLHAPDTSLSHDNRKRRMIRKIKIGVCAGVGSCILTCFLFFICHRYRKRRFATASKLLSRSFSSDPSSQSELGKGGSILPTHIFTYKELEDATNNFDPSKELGDGGFGTVYHGKLRDGRSVAVKRLYENNCRRVEQFMNEIDILSRLRHRSLVTLYGCTSRHSRELLLVYEFIPNGTVADHLHGNHAKDGALTWPIRMSIAVESADALAYLHAVEIIHRDVKTNNILLDNNFNVKVADFGLSRLFPTDRTHVSTAPQGTPGYVDPDYHRCYQLNDKSDVYSFGVVLIELISSKPAVDITRHRQEINLANMAINKIHNHALNELVDPTLGYESDHAVRRMITLVAELAFRCLQDEKEVRPTMQEVLEVLKGIQREDYKVEKAEELDVLAVADEAVLLKKFRPLSPDSVTDMWISRSTTPNASG